MPITQQRILDLLNEYELHLQVLDNLRGAMLRVAETYAQESPGICEIIRAECRALQTFPRSHYIWERKHFARNAKRNERTRENMALARRARGIPERNSPADIMQRQTAYEDISTAREYHEAMRGRPITEADIAQARGARSIPLAEAGHAGRQEDKMQVKEAQAQVQAQVMENEEIIAKDAEGHTMTRQEVQEMNRRNQTNIEDL